MGAIDVNVQYLWEPKGGKWWLVLALGRGSPAYHGGFAVGPYDEIRDSDGQGVALALIMAAGDGEASFADALGDLSAANTGPFPGVAPATWFDGLPSAVKGELLDGLEAWAATNELP
jgi:hypothetical protein